MIFNGHDIDDDARCKLCGRGLFEIVIGVEIVVCDAPAEPKKWIAHDDMTLADFERGVRRLDRRK